MKYTFGEKSQRNLVGVDARLQKVCRQALRWGVLDFSVIEGHRDVSRQQELFARGLTEKDGVNKLSKHNHYPSQAVDIVPYPPVLAEKNVWNDHARFHLLAGVMFAAASELGYNIRWGGDWNMNGTTDDESFLDLVHFEILDN